ncbi:MAG: hypothetical protein RRC07_17470 [Anaerolineae bacterium]|nr:hypothetical protein [Anaerolineae bacterium]
MNKSQFAALLFLGMLILALGTLALPATAGAAAPATCPNGYMEMPADHHDHDGDHDHQGHLHTGLWPNADLNGDGTVCVKHLNQGGQHIHVFIDNVVR